MFAAWGRGVHRFRWMTLLVSVLLLGATVVPSLMRLLGRVNWWAPGPLARLHRRLGLNELPAADSPGEEVRHAAA